MKIHSYAVETFNEMAKVDSEGNATRSVMVVHYPEHVRATMPDGCPGETAEEVFEELSWEMAMAELRAFGGAR